MKTKRNFFYWTAWVLVLFLAAPPWVIAQGPQGTQRTQGAQESKPFKQDELAQMLAPIALYPDDLLTQILMASTYPLEIVQAARWATKNKDLKGDKLTEALEKEDWDPSVKSLVNFPDVLSKMNENLEWTQKMGDAFLAQQKEVMDTIQMLRKKAQEAGNLKDTKEQKVVQERETIIIQSASPEVIYVPSYSPSVVYGGWWWPAFPPPPPFFPYVAPYGGALAFGAGVAMGAAWGYAWGHANWHGGDVNINASRNTNINNNINRDKYKADMKNKGLGEGGQGKWQHDSSHRKGASYRDQGTAQKFNRGTTSDAAKSREAFRGRADQGRQDPSRGGGDRGSFDRGSSQRGGRDSAFGGSQRGSEARQQSNRGASSRQSMSSSGGSRGGGGGGGRSGGGGGGGRR
jgi:Spy/CpxP family protein refolding chaperone